MSAPLALRSQIDAVTVYRRGAMITRRAQLAVGARVPRHVQLVGLPLGLDDGSVRVEVDSPELVAGDLQVTLAVPGRDDELGPPTHEALEDAALAVAVAKAEIGELERARARLEALAPVARGRPEKGKAPSPSPTTKRLELLAFRRSRSAALAERLVEARAHLRELDETLASLREQQRRASSARNARANELRKAARLELHASGETLREPASIELHYFVPGARWAPSYTVRLSPDMRAAGLELRAMVGQSTGEDWAGVEMTLSTATPQRWTELPKLDSRRIGRRQAPPAKTGWRPPPIGAASLYTDYDRGLAEPEPEPEPLAEPSLPMSPPPPPPSPPPAQAISFAAQAMPESRTRERSMKRAVLAEEESMMPVMPAAPLSAPARSRSSGLGGFVGNAIDGLTSALAPEAGRAATPSLRAGGPGPEGGAGAPPAPPPEPELLAGRELLDYGRLRMLAAHDPQRGALRHISLRVHYEQTIGESVSLELALDQIAEAHEWAELLETESPPDGHRWPEAEDGFDYAYVAAAPVDLPSTGGFRSLAVDLREASAQPRYVSVPRESQDVFRIVGLTNPLDAPLLPGPVDVYVDGKFMLTSALDTTPAGAKLELGVGVEQNIKISRNVKYHEDSEGMFKRQLALSHTLELEVHNHLSAPALVEIRERVPVVDEALGDDISVELGAVSPAWEDYEPKRAGRALLGGRRWRIEVPPGAERALSATYVIRLPTNHELVGGNRRDS